MLITHTTKNNKETQKMGENFAKEVLCKGLQKKAVVIGLQGSLGAGKTTFLQGFAKGLGIKEKVLSPTFVIQKRFEIKNSVFNNFYHIDCYRLENKKDILQLDFKNIIANPKHIVAIEWPEKIKKILPKDSVLISFEHSEKGKRKIIFLRNYI